MFCKCRKVVLATSCLDEKEVEKEDLMNICKVLPCRDMEAFVAIGTSSIAT